MKVIAGESVIWHGGLNIGEGPAGDVPAIPVTQADTATVEAGATVQIDVLANDVDLGGGSLTLAGAEVVSGGGSVSVGSGRLVYVAGAAGDVELRYTVRNSVGATATGRVAVTVEAGATPPAPTGPAWVAGDIVLIGASLLSRAANEPTSADAASLAHVNDVFARLGFAGTLQNRAQGSARFSDTIAALPGIVDDYAPQTALYVIHRSGNDVTDTRPWNGSQQALFDDGLRDIDALIPAAADRVNMTISKRLYAGNVDYTYGAVDTAGSRPYNVNAVIPFIQENQPDWLENGAPVLDGYDFTAGLVAHMVNDGVHFDLYAEHLLTEWSVWRIATFKGLFAPPAAQTLAGKSILCSFRQAVGREVIAHADRAGVTSSTVNYVPGGNFGLVAHDGTSLPGVAVHMHQWANIPKAGAVDFGNPVTNPRIADPRLKTAEMMDVSMYTSTTSVVYYRCPVGQVRFHGLPPGMTGTAVFAGMRNGTGPRSMDVTHGGVTVACDAANNAASNQASIGFTIAPDGTLVFDIANTAGSKNAYLGACILDFD